MSAWFRNFVENSDRKAGQHLSAAKHRFCSYSKPMSRCILHFDCIVHTLNRAVATNGAEWAHTWMSSMSETKFLLLGMMTDLSQSCLELTRFFDSEHMEIAEMNREVHYFDQQLEAGHWKKLFMIVDCMR